MKKAFLTVLIIVFALNLVSCRNNVAKQEKEDQGIIETKELKMEGNLISLPEPKKEGQVSLEEAFLKRRSKRDFRQESIAIKHLSQLLWAAQGMSDEESGFRTVPSAGALYPLEIYVVVKEGGVEELGSGVYYYLPEGHKLTKLTHADISQNLTESALGQSSVGQAAANIIIAADFKRTTSKYGERGVRYVYIEAGHAAQNILLQAAALDLGAVPIGAFDDQQVKEILGIEEEDEPLYIIPVGRI